MLATYYPVDTSTSAAESEKYRISGLGGGPASQGTKPRERYATAAYLPNSGGAGNVLILSGTGGSAVGAAADFLLDETSMAQLRSRLGAKARGGFPYFEILLKVEKGNLPKYATILICRAPLDVK